MTAERDAVGNGHRWEPYLGHTPILLLDGRDVLQSTGRLAEDEAWSLVCRIARDLNGVAEQRPLPVCPACGRRRPGYLRQGWGVVTLCRDPFHGAAS